MRVTTYAEPASDTLHVIDPAVPYQQGFRMACGQFFRGGMMMRTSSVRYAIITCPACADHLPQPTAD